MAAFLTALRLTPDPRPATLALEATVVAARTPTVDPRYLQDPRGLCVVPFRPTTRWPLRRSYARIYDPFRAFPYRAVHLATWLDASAPRR